MLFSVIPVKTEIQYLLQKLHSLRTPAFAGETTFYEIIYFDHFLKSHYSKSWFDQAFE
jgi:hypothetical protein